MKVWRVLGRDREVLCESESIALKWASALDLEPGVGPTSVEEVAVERLEPLLKRDGLVDWQAVGRRARAWG